MNKSELKTGMILKHRRGDLSTVFINTTHWEDCIVFSDSNQTGLESFSDDLEWYGHNNNRSDFEKGVDVVAVYKASLPTMFINPNSKSCNHTLELLWERKEPLTKNKVKQLLIYNTEATVIDIIFERGITNG